MYAPTVHNGLRIVRFIVCALGRVIVQHTFLSPKTARRGGDVGHQASVRRGGGKQRVADSDYFFATAVPDSLGQGVCIHAS